MPTVEDAREMIRYASEKHPNVRLGAEIMSDGFAQLLYMKDREGIDRVTIVAASKDELLKNRPPNLLNLFQHRVKHAARQLERCCFPVVHEAHPSEREMEAVKRISLLEDALIDLVDHWRANRGSIGAGYSAYIDHGKKVEAAAKFIQR